MQKKLIALAIAGMAAAPAFAQSNVQIYGRLDLGLYERTDDGRGLALEEISANRWGLRGQEDLSKDLAAYFHLENRFRTDTGVERDGVASLQWTDKAWLGLNYKPVGKVQFGRVLTVQNGGLMGGGDYEALTDTAATVLSRNGQKEDRLNNAIYFESRSFGGFQFALHKQLSESTAGNTDKGGAGALVTYRSGPIKAVTYYQRDVSPQHYPVSGTFGASMWNVLGVGFAYDLKFMKIKTTAAFNRGTGDDDLGINNRDYRQKAWQLSLNFPIGNGELGTALSFRRIKGNRSSTTASDTVAPQESRFSLGYIYNLSRRTKLIATTAFDKTNSQGDNNDKYTLDSGGAADSKTRWTHQVGIRHEF